MRPPAPSAVEGREAKRLGAQYKPQTAAMGGAADPLWRLSRKRCRRRPPPTIRSSSNGLKPGCVRTCRRMSRAPRTRRTSEFAWSWLWLLHSAGRGQGLNVETHRSGTTRRWLTENHAVPYGQFCVVGGFGVFREHASDHLTHGPRFFLSPAFTRVTLWVTALTGQ